MGVTRSGGKSAGGGVGPAAPIGWVVTGGPQLWRQAVEAAVSTGLNTLPSSNPSRPDVVITVGLDALAESKRRWAAARHVVLSIDADTPPSAHNDVTTLPSSSTVAMLLGAVRSQTTSAKRSWQPTALAPAPLTSREVAVIEGVARGSNAREIAAALGVSPRTVEAHKQRIFAKWGVRSQAQVVELALRHRVIVTSNT